MKIFPQHLRDRQHAEIIQRRTYGLFGKGKTEGVNIPSGPLPSPHIGMLGKLWKKNSGLTDEQAATGLSAAAMSTLSTMWAVPTITGGLGLLISAILMKKTGYVEPFQITAALTAVVSYLSAVPWARASFQNCYKKPVLEGEIDYLLENEVTTGTELEISYLRLLRDTVRQKSPVSPETEANIQAAITALGEAIDRLPVVSVTSVDTAALRREAEVLQNEALHQSDPVISESQERRASAILRRIEANERSSLGVRRITALRAEMEAQIAGLREGIAALDVGYGNADHATANDLATLSESARRVASEATSVADAHSELASALSYAPVTPVVESETPQQIQLRKR